MAVFVNRMNGRYIRKDWSIQNNLMSDKFRFNSLLGRTVLIIDDDEGSLQLISRAFIDEGAHIILARDGLDGVDKVLSHQPDLIILNISLPGMDGFLVYQEIRGISNAPLIMLSVQDHEKLILQGLEAGANDIMPKPISPAVLLARARAAIHRRPQMTGARLGFNFDDGYLKIDVSRQRVHVNDKTIKLSPTEFRLLVFLLRNTDQVVTFGQILTNVWGEEHGKSRDYVHVYVSHLRSKIEPNPKKPQYILSIRGVGYLFER